LKGAGWAVGKNGNEEIDGVIKWGRRGLDTIYIQARRRANAIGGREIQKFAGTFGVNEPGKEFLLPQVTSLRKLWITWARPTSRLISWAEKIWRSL